MSYNICNHQLHPNKLEPFLGLVRYYRKFIKGFTKIAISLTLLTIEQVKFEWTPVHHTTFLHLKAAIVQTPILHYPNPDKKYIVYTNASDDTCGAQLSQEHNGTEFPIAFLSHLHRNPMEVEYYWTGGPMASNYAITKLNYYLQGANIIVKNDHKPLAWFLNG